MLGRLSPAPALSRAAGPETRAPQYRAWGDIVALLAMAAWLLCPREY